MVFEVVPLNPIRFTDMEPYDFDHATPKCYFQKYNVTDQTKIQILSDTPDITFTAHSFDTNEEIFEFVVTEIPTMLIGQTFKVYESEINWNAIGNGRYYLKLESPLGIYYSEPIWVDDNHPNTILFRYRNSVNNFSVVFDTQILFQLRVEGDIQNFAPRFDDEIYNDQKRNATKLSSVPYRTWTLYIGAAPGLPDWMTDKVNRVMSCDMVQIDGDWFEKVADSEWEIARQDEYPFSGLQIEIMPTNNLFLERLKFQTDDPDDDMANKVLLRISENYDNVSGSITVNNIFKDKTVLVYLRVFRRGGAFTFRVGTTNGGAEIGEFETFEVNATYQVRYPFDSPTVVYVTGLGTDCDVSLVYEQLDAVGGGDGGVIPPTPATAPVGAVWMYEQPFATFQSDFDIVTGLGKLGGLYQGWAICNGDNGTIDMRESVPVGWSDANPDFNTLGAPMGANKKAIPVESLPAHSHGFDGGGTTFVLNPGSSTTPSGGGDTSRRSLPQGQFSQPATTASAGAGEQFDVMQKSSIVVFIKKVS